MNIVTLDFESHYSDDYTLSKMTTESYIRDSRFEALGVAVRRVVDDPSEHCARQAGEAGDDVGEAVEVERARESAAAIENDVAAAA